MQSKFTIVDAHVHIYDQFSFPMILEKAYENSWHVAHYHGHDQFQTLLLLTETAKENWFTHFEDKINGMDLQGWQGRRLEHEPAIIFSRGIHRIILVAGYQVATEEGLEVLGLGSTLRAANGMDLETTVEVVIKQGALAVIPWAVGKWLGKRGKKLTRFLKQQSIPGLCLGDNGGRPWCWPAPKLFSLMQERGRPVLPGSDPLPLVHQESQVAGFGFFTQAPISLDSPVSDLKALLTLDNPPISPFGKLESISGFISNQLRLRMK